MAVAVGLSTVGIANATQISYGITAGSSIGFNGNSTFDFVAGTNGADFVISSGTATGDLGTIGGLFTIGTISGTTASITGPGSLTIVDGSDTLTAGLTWNNISTVGTGSTLNYTGSVNLTGVTYTGLNPLSADLLALVGNTDEDTLDFTFTSSPTLAQLADSAQSTSFSGTIATVTVPDGGTTAMLLGAGLSGLALLKRKLVA